MRSIPSVPQRGAGGAALAGGTGGVPLFLKTLEGGAGGIAAQAKPDPWLKDDASQDKTIRPHRRADAGIRSPCHTPLAKYEQLCYSTPMKSADSPLLFLGACRIHSVLEANHRESPCGRGAEGTSSRRIAFRGTMGPEPMPFRDKLLGAIRLRHGSLRLHYGSSQLSYGSVPPCYAFCYGSVPTNPEIRLIRVTNPLQPSQSPDSFHIEVLWITTRAPAAVALGRPPAAQPTQGAVPTPLRHSPRPVKYRPSAQRRA